MLIRICKRVSCKHTVSSRTYYGCNPLSWISRHRRQIIIHIGQHGGSRMNIHLTPLDHGLPLLLLANQKRVTLQEVVPYDAEKLSEQLLELAIDDFEEQEGMCRVITSRENFVQVRKDIEQLGYNITDADMQFLPQNEITLSDENYASFEKIIEALQDDEDVDSVYHNVG